MTSIKEAGYIDYAASRRIERERQVADLSASKTNESSSVSTDKTVGDTLSLSATGELLLLKKTEVEQYLKEIEKIETTDEKTLSQIRQKVKAGAYSGPEVIAQVVDGLVSSSASSQVAATNVEQTAAQTETSPEIEAIREKIRAGYYDSEEVYGDIASKMLNPDYLISE